jgi:hypothetical protein
MANNHGQKQIFCVRDTTPTYLVFISTEFNMMPRNYIGRKEVKLQEFAISEVAAGRKLSVQTPVPEKGASAASGLKIVV